jgi:hypothetical protein
MTAMTLSRIVTLCLLLCAFASQAQSINERWLGTWQSGNQKIIISPTSFDNCRWSNSKPKAAHKNCLAYYDGLISKQDLVQYAKSDMDNVNRWLSEKNISASDYQGFKKDIQNSASVLTQVSPDKFKQVILDYGDMASPDGGTIYFLDKENIYAVSVQEGAIAPMFSIKKFTR